MQPPKALGLLVCLIFLLDIEPAIGMFDATLKVVEMIIKNDTTFMDASGLKFVTYTFKKSGNEFKKLPYKVGPLPFCKYFDEEKFFVDTIRTTSDIPARGTCPWPKKRYTINNFFLNLDNIPPVFSTGEYRLNSEFYLDGKLLNGISVLLNLVSVL
ncbi:unnamed protein product [Diamesa tonsa]